MHAMNRRTESRQPTNWRISADGILVEIGEQPKMRHYDLADRSGKKFTGQIDLYPREAWVVSASAGVGTDDYDDSYFGLQEAGFRTFGFGVDFQQPNGLGAGGSYNYERYTGFQHSRSASPNQTPPQETDPLRDWTTDSKERVHYFSLYASPPRFGPNTEARATYDYSDARAATVAYAYERFRVFDFAMDPSVVNSIVQPSSLVLGYVYRPYTTQMAVVGLLYFW
jgi:hypothetical protein